MIKDPWYILPNEEGFKGNLLDAYLEAGYYRMMHMVFTTYQTDMGVEGNSLPVFWLRTKLNAINESSSAKAIRKKCSAFSVTCKEAVIDEEVEALYRLYHSAIDFTTGGSCYSCMHDDRLPNPFDSRMIEVRHNKQLVAAGYFDVGSNTITGILNFYHPDYKKYSLGKYLILQKIDWAVSQQIDWYYTGYIGIGTTKFDYKLFPDTRAVEVFLPVERTWIAFPNAGKKSLENYWDKYV